MTRNEWADLIASSYNRLADECKGYELSMTARRWPDYVIMRYTWLDTEKHLSKRQRKTLKGEQRTDARSLLEVSFFASVDGYLEDLRALQARGVPVPLEEPLQGYVPGYDEN